MTLPAANFLSEKIEHKKGNIYFRSSLICEYCNIIKLIMSGSFVVVVAVSLLEHTFSPMLAVNLFNI